MNVIRKQGQPAGQVHSWILPFHPLAGLFLWRPQMETQKCFKCHVVKPMSEFYAHPRMANGHLGKCKECTKQDVLENRIAHLSAVREYDRERGKLPHRKAANALRQRMPHVKEQHQKALKEYAARFPERKRATTMIHNALRDKKLSRPTRCELCGSRCKPVAHHFDYDRPLDVVWLCISCHNQLHRRYNPISLAWPMAM